MKSILIYNYKRSLLPASSIFVALLVFIQFNLLKALHLPDTFGPTLLSLVAFFVFSINLRNLNDDFINNRDFVFLTPKSKLQMVLGYTFVTLSYTFVYVLFLSTLMTHGIGVIGKLSNYFGSFSYKSLISLICSVLFLLLVQILIAWIEHFTHKHVKNKILSAIVQCSIFGLFIILVYGLSSRFHILNTFTLFLAVILLSFIVLSVVGFSKTMGHKFKA